MGIFAQQVSGGDTQFAPQAGIQDDSTAKLIGFVGEQALEANRGYHDAQLERETRGEIESRLSNAYLQYASGENTELTALGAELKKYKQGYDQGAMNNSQLAIRVEDARKKAINLMPGRVGEINTLSQQTLGQYDSALSAVKAEEDARAKGNAANDKAMRTFMAEKTSIPYSEAYGPKTVQELTQQYPEEIQVGENKLNAERNVKAMTTYDKGQESLWRKNSGTIVYGESKGMNNNMLLIASRIAGRQIINLNDLSSEEKAAVRTGIKLHYDKRKSDLSAEMQSKGYNDFAQTWDNTIGQSLSTYDSYLSGEIQLGQLETDIALTEGGAKYEMLGTPGAPEMVARINVFKGSNMVLPGSLTMKAEQIFMSGTNVSGTHADPSNFSDSESAGNIVNFMDSIARTDLNQEQQAAFGNVINNMDVNFGSISDPQVVQDLMSLLADPALTARFQPYTSNIQNLVGNTVKRMAGGVVEFLGDNEMRLDILPDGKIIPLGGTAADRSKFINMYSKTFNAISSIHSNFSNKEWSAFLNYLGLEDTVPNNTTDSPESNDLSSKFEQEVMRIADQKDSSDAEKDAQLKVLIGQFKEKGFDVSGGGSYAS